MAVSSYRLVVAALLVVLAVPCALAADNPGVKNPARALVPDEPARARELLDTAVKYYRDKGKQAFAAFSRADQFVDGNLYVFAIGDDGILQASGGPSAIFLGRDVRNLKDVDGKLFIRELLDGAKAKGSGQVEYRWLNREHGKEERKVAYYRKVGETTLAVGYYIPHASPQAAKDLLARAVEAMEKDPKLAMSQFNSMNGGYNEDDLYVFVVGINDRIMHAHGSIPRLIGRNVSDMRDINGKHLLPQMIDIVTSKGGGELKYVWPNKVTGKQEQKTTYLRRVGEYLVAVGHY